MGAARTLDARMSMHECFCSRADFAHLHRFPTPIVPVDSSHTVPTPLIVPIARIPRGSPFNRTRSRHHRIAADVHRYGLVMVTCIVTDCGGDHRFAVVARD